MTPGNFNWFLHTMLFYHMKHVIEKQRQKMEKEQNQEESSEDSDEEYDD